MGTDASQAFPDFAAYSGPTRGSLVRRLFPVDSTISPYVAATVLAAGVMLWHAGGARADEPYEAAAKRLSQATVMVRMSLADHGKPSREESVREESPGKSSRASHASRRERTTIGSGVVVAENLVVTAIRPDRGCRFVLTLPGGTRAAGELCVVDANSSLTLLKVTADEQSKAALPQVALSAKQPALGARLLAASAWGAEPPSVSLGVLGGVDRFVPGAGLPPLVQCDVHTTETSLGAGIVNVDGELVGIVAACDGRGGNARWTYAVPAEHVRRLLDARRDGALVEIPRQRPHAGIELRQVGGSDVIVVRRVTEGGPAAKAGIEAGDVVAKLDGQPASSVLEAARLVACRKPGDAVEFEIRRGAQVLDCVVTLEQGDREPMFSYATKRKSNPEHSDDEAGRSAEAGRDGQVGKNGRSDPVEEFRRQLRQRDERIARLEAELADLRQAKSRQALGDVANAAGAPKEAEPPTPAAEPTSPTRSSVERPSDRP
jgi:S1-C subfamily serine protease